MYLVSGIAASLLKIRDKSDLCELNLLVSVRETREDEGSSLIRQRQLRVDQDIPATSCNSLSGSDQMLM